MYWRIEWRLFPTRQTSPGRPFSGEGLNNY